MKHVLPRFQRPIKSKGEPFTDVSHWSKAVEAYDAKDYRKALIETINYINSALLEGKDTDRDIEIVQSQGSAEIQMTITDNIFSIRAPFLKITEQTNKVALFRKVSEINFHPLKLAQIQLDGDTLWFGYKTNIALCQPYKVYDVLRDICVYSDNYDDEFIDKYKADFYQEPKVTPLTDVEKEQVWQQIESILNEYQEFSAFFKEKRWDDFQWDISVISILKIVNMPCVHGTLRTSLESYISTLFDGRTDFRQRVDKSFGFMQKLCGMTKEEYLASMYHAEAVISIKWRSSTQILQNEAQNMKNNVDHYVQKNDNLMLCYYLQYSFLYTLFNLNVEEHHKEAIYKVLERISGMEIDIAAPLLLETYHGFLNGVTETAMGASFKKGFFSKLFS